VIIADSFPIVTLSASEQRRTLLVARTHALTTRCADNTCKAVRKFILFRDEK
jgi:hypothetical protein